MEKMPAQGVTHQHWRVGSKINRQKLIWRVPVTVPSGFRDSRQYLEYQQECYAAVSYTHLDVYKRQVSDLEQLRQLLLHFDGCPLKAVSYTHLDVYKRQTVILT